MCRLLTLLLVAILACGGGGDRSDSGGLTFTLPQDGATLSAPQGLAVSGDRIIRVEFRLDNSLLLEDAEAPFEWTLDPADYTPGLHELTILAFTESGSESASVPIIVQLPPPPPPTLSAVVPAAGSVSGGTTITLTGASFIAGAAVTVGDVAATGVSVTSATSIRCTTPAGAAPGTVDVRVTTTDGSATLADGFEYEAITGTGVFPLSIHSGGRYLVRTDGKAFLIHGDTPWSIALQLTHSQIETYLDKREEQGFNAIMFNMIDHLFSSQSPAWKNAQSGAVPFGSIDSGGQNVDWLDPVESYWATVDYIIDEAKARGILCICQPAYLGFNGGQSGAGDQGWMGAVENATDAELEDYGEWLAERYDQGNVIWCMGGDFTPSDVSKQWNIAVGIRNIDPDAIISAHGSRSDASAYQGWSGETGFNLNNVYSDGVEYDIADVEYGRSGPMPFFLIEGYYDGESATNLMARRQAYATILSGGCGHLFGNNPIWGFGEPNANRGGGAASALSGSLETTATQHMEHVKSLFDAYDWWKLVPESGSALVTSAKGSGASRVMAASASDKKFAMIWKPSSGSVTIDLSALDPSSIRARFYDTTTGTYTTVTGSPFSNSSTQSISWPGERVLVLDAE